MTINSKEMFIIPYEMTSCFFSFEVKTAAQNKNLSRQMDSNKFLISIEQMIRKIAKGFPIDGTIVLQVANATYHRQVADLTL